MKSFKLYIKESLLDDEDEIASNIDDELIIQYLNKYYKFNYHSPGRPDDRNPNYEIDDNKVVHVYGGVSIKDKSIESLTNGFFKFGIVSGFFICSNCANLKSLEGAPQLVSGSFDCHGCSSLKSLEGGPQYVGTKSSRTNNQWNAPQYNCSGTAITSLKGAPRGYVDNSSGFGPGKSVGVDGAIYVHTNIKDCPNLTTIDWNIKKYYGNFSIQNCPNLRDLKGMPQKIYGELWINLCNSLKSLEGGPSYISDELQITSCDNFKTFGKCFDLKFKYKKLKIICRDLPSFDSLEEIPDQIYYLGVDKCPRLKTLKGAPTDVTTVSIKSCTNLKDLGGWKPKPSCYIAITRDMQDFQQTLEDNRLGFRYAVG